MNTPWTSPADDVQEYLSMGVSPLPFVYVTYLQELHDMERNQKVCMLPLPRLELYHAQLEQKLIMRIRKKHAA